MGLTLKARALQLLAQREHSPLELRRKLLDFARRQAAQPVAPTQAPARAAREQAPGVEAGIDALLDWLTAHQYLNETRFIESRLRTRAARHGNVRIRQELAQHGLRLAPKEEQALKESEFARAKAVWARKFGAAAADAAGRARQARFLAGRGFSAEVIHRLLRDDCD